MKKHKRNTNGRKETQNELFGSALGLFLTIGLGVYLHYGLGVEMLIYIGIVIFLAVTAVFLSPS